MNQIDPITERIFLKVDFSRHSFNHHSSKIMVSNPPVRVVASIVAWMRRLVKHFFAPGGMLACAVSAGESVCGRAWGVQGSRWNDASPGPGGAGRGVHTQLTPLRPPTPHHYTPIPPDGTIHARYLLTDLDILHIIAIDSEPTERGCDL